MKCSEFDARMQLILDRKEDPVSNPRLAAHARSCTACEATLAAWREVAFALRGEPKEADEARRDTVPSGRIAAVGMESGRPTSGPRPRSKALRRAIASSSAAATVIAATVILLITFITSGNTSSERVGARWDALQPTLSNPRTADHASSPKVAEIKVEAVQDSTYSAELLPLTGPLAAAAPVMHGSQDIGLNTGLPVDERAFVAGSEPFDLVESLLRNSSELLSVSQFERYRPSGLGIPQERLWPGPVTGSLRPVAESLNSTYNVLRSHWPI